MSGDSSKSSFSLRIGPQVRVACHTYPDRTPILAAHDRSVTVTFTVDAERPTASDVGFARALADHARVFAIEVERRFTDASSAATWVA